MSTSPPPPPDLENHVDKTEFVDYSSSLFVDSQLPEEDSEQGDIWVLDTLSPWDLGTQVEESEMEDEIDDDNISGQPEIDYDLPENKDSFDILCVFVPAYRQVYPIWKREVNFCFTYFYPLLP